MAGIGAAIASGSGDLGRVLSIAGSGAGTASALGGTIDRVGILGEIAAVETTGTADVTVVHGGVYFYVDGSAIGTLSRVTSAAATASVGGNAIGYLVVPPLSVVASVDAEATRVLNRVTPVAETIGVGGDAAFEVLGRVTLFFKLLMVEANAFERPFRFVLTTAQARAGARDRVFVDVRSVRSVAAASATATGNLTLNVPYHRAIVDVEAIGDLLAVKPYVAELVVRTDVGPADVRVVTLLSDVLEVLEEEPESLAFLIAKHVEPESVIPVFDRVFAPLRS